MAEARAVVCQNVVPVRATSSPRSEQVSQTIFGETVRLLRIERDCSEIQTPDGYGGWTLSTSLSILETGEKYPLPDRAVMVAPLFLPVFREPRGRSERITLLTLGTAVELSSGDDRDPFYPIRFPTGETGYVESDTLIVPRFPPVQHLGPNLAVVARGLIGVPYLWGGRTPFGIDCSGFVQRIFWLCGQVIPRDAWQQAESPIFDPVNRSGLESGDLVFFRSEDNPRKRTVTHVGLALDARRFIHASAPLGVAISSLDDEPYASEYQLARRLTRVEG